VGPAEVELLYFGNHDDAYAWADRNQDEIPRLVERAKQLSPVARMVDVLQSVGVDQYDPVCLKSIEDLQRMLDHGMAAYIAYLDEHQQYLAELDRREQHGPVLVKGGAGTGKTALAIARVRYLAERPEFGYGPALYLCYNRGLRSAVTQVLDCQYGGSFPRDQISVDNIDAWCRRYLSDCGVEVEIETSQNYLNFRIKKAVDIDSGLRERLAPFSIQALADEVRLVLRPNGLSSVEAYLNLERRGMSRLGHEQRRAIWELYQSLNATRSKLEFPEVIEYALEHLVADSQFMPYRAVVIDEGQDFSPVMVRLARALVGGDERRLYVLVDAAQSIYPSGFYWAQRELGAKGGQIRSLRKSYRSTVQVQHLADSLYRHDDEIKEEFKERYPADRNGPVPQFTVCFTQDDEVNAIVSRVVSILQDQREDGGRWQPDQVAVLAPQWAVLEKVNERLIQSGVPATLVRDSAGGLWLAEATVKLLTIHSAKGLDFPIVFLCGLYESPVISSFAPEHRALLYVGITRASHKLALSTTFAKRDPLLYDLDPECYRLDGDAAVQFEAARLVNA
jgi:superfamily I DNA/RNA helicase